MSVLVTGANGLLGSAVISTLKDQGRDVIGAYHSESPEFEILLVRLDIRNTEEIVRYLTEYDIDTVINCAAATDVDACESDPDHAHEINATAPGSLAELCDDRGIDFVHYSTDYVFDGKSTSRYTEDDQPSPIQEYGISKLAGERAVHESHADALVLRLSFVYGSRGDTGDLAGFPRWVVENLQEGNEAPLFMDQKFTPSRAGQVAITTLALLEDGLSGLYHVACQSCITPYEFGQQICDLIDGDETLISSASVENSDRTAARPRCSCFDVSKVEKRLGRSQPALREDLDAIYKAFTDHNL